MQTARSTTTAPNDALVTHFTSPVSEAQFQEHVQNVSDFLTTWANQGDRNAAAVIRGAANTDTGMFYSSRIPDHSIEFYVNRFFVDFRVVRDYQSILANVLFCLDRYCKNTRDMINNRNIHRLLLASMYLVQRSFLDHFRPSEFYAKCGGIYKKNEKNAEMNKLHNKLFQLLDYKVIPINPNELTVYYDLFHADATACLAKIAPSVSSTLKCPVYVAR